MSANEIVRHERHCDKCGREFILEYDPGTGRARQSWQVGCDTMRACVERILDPWVGFERAIGSNILIEELGWTGRVYNAFKRNGITRLAQVVEMSDAQLLAWPNFSKISLSEVRETQEKALDPIGFVLRRANAAYLDRQQLGVQEKEDAREAQESGEIWAEFKKDLDAKPVVEIEVTDARILEEYQWGIDHGGENVSVKLCMARASRGLGVSIERVMAVVDRDCGIDGSESGEQ